MTRPFGITTWGGTITDAIANAITLASRERCGIFFDFNGVEVKIEGDSNPALIYRDWERALRGYIPSPIGPHPAATLTAEELRSDETIQKAKEKELRKRYGEMEQTERAKAKRVKAMLATAPAMTLADAALWQKGLDANRDGYGGGVYSYAERWARLMQRAIDSGEKLEDVADALSSDADLEGITGFMYGCAVSVLSACWIHGEELRRWHNLKTQIGHEGERANESGAVLNPALLSLG